MAKYETLASEIRSLITGGRLAAGDKLDTETVMMSRWRVSRHTVRQALDLLENQGLISRRQGSGSFVLPRQTAQGTAARTVGVVCTYITDYIFPSIVKGIESELTANGWLLALSATNNQADTEAMILRSYIEKPVSGLIIEGSKTAVPNPNIDMYRQLGRLGVPIVFIHARYGELPDIVTVSVNDREGGRRAVKYLYDRGHEKIAGIFKCTDRQGHDRYAGYLDGLRENGLGFTDDRVAWFQDNRQFGLLLDGGGIDQYLNGATAVVCYNDQIASMLISGLNRAGMSVPGDISVVSFDDSSFAELTSPPLTSFAHPKEALGRTAARKITNMIAGAQEESLVMDWGLAERDSVRDINR